MEGILEKPSRIPGRKTKVWSVLGDTTLSFFQENKRSSCIASVELTDIQKVTKVSECQFDIVTDINSQTYTASSQEQCREWVEKLSKFSSGQSEPKNRVRESLAVLGTRNAGNDHTIEVKSARVIFEKSQPQALKISSKQVNAEKEEAEISEKVLFNSVGNSFKSKDAITTTYKGLSSDSKTHRTEKDKVISSKYSVGNSFDIGNTGTRVVFPKRTVSSTLPKSSQQELSVLRNSDPTCLNLNSSLQEVRSHLHHVSQKTESLNPNSEIDTHLYEPKPEFAIARNRLKHISSSSEGKDNKSLGNIANISENIGNEFEVMENGKSKNNGSERIHEKGESSNFTKMDESHWETTKDGPTISENDILSRNTRIRTVGDLENSNDRSLSNDKGMDKCCNDYNGKSEQQEEAVVVMRKSNRSVSVSRSDVVTQIPIDDSNTEDNNGAFAFPNSRRKNKSSVKCDRNVSGTICENPDQSKVGEKENNLAKAENVKSGISVACSHDDLDGGTTTVISQKKIVENYLDIDSLLNDINFASAPTLPNDIPNREDLISFHELKLTLEDLVSDDDQFDDSFHAEDVIKKLSRLVES